MSYQIPDPRFEMPELLIPGRKPTGRVAIDWSHPLARDLIACPIFLSGTAFDLVQKKYYTDGGGTTTVINEGKSINVDSTSSAGVRIEVNTVSSKGFTLIARFQLSNLGAGQGIVSFGHTSNLDWIRATAQTNVALDPMRLQVGKSDLGQEHVDLGSTSTDRAFCACVVDDNNDSITGYFNDLSGTDSSTRDSITINRFEIGAWSKGATFYQPTDGDIIYAYGWNRMLSEVEVNSIRYSPYQFLIPA